MTIEQIAKVCHQVNRAYCFALGDTSQLPWDVAPEWQRVSSVAQAQFHIDNPDAPPSSSHDSWLAEKVNDGWAHGPVKDADAKTHPCIVPFDQLSVEQQAKDHIFSAIVCELKGFL